MKKYLKLLCVGILVSLILVVTSVSGRAEPNLAQSHSKWMNTGESFRVSSFFFENELISGECANDCYDIDLTLYEANMQNAVAQDHGDTATPMVRAPYEGDFTLEVSMANCARTRGCRAWVSSEYGF
ncbi:MAG: hypothetical protein F6K42_16630 [Leptolyngbya sp. SIO1D8]|nr:hypothetical protein [Leptolyngbya sp. SIO1D8]